MNKKFIRDFTAGESVVTPLLISNLTRGVTANGAPYLSITLSDKTGTMEGKLWDVNKLQEALAVVGKIRLFDIDVINYKNNLQAKIHSLSEINEEEINMQDFLASSEIAIEDMRKYVYGTVEEIKNENLHLMVTTILNECDSDFFEYPAASKNHHNFVGGLAEHVCGMLKMGKALCNCYPMLNRDLLLSGIILHDIGKLQELSGILATEYTPAGKLLGHISLMQARIAETGKRLGIEDSEEVLLLRHMILSHHGEYEYGSPVLPMIPEAEALSSIDNLDARMNMIRKVMNEVKPGEFSSRVFSLENRSFYRPKIK